MKQKFEKSTDVIVISAEAGIQSHKDSLFNWILRCKAPQYDGKMVCNDTSENVEKKIDCRASLARTKAGTGFCVTLLLAVTMCFGVGISEAKAQSCLKTPTCAELGYAQSASNCTGKTILKCPLDTSRVYCPSDMESSRIYKVGDTFVDNNGIALGKVITLTDGGQHGRIMTTSSYFINDYAQVTKICLDKKTGGRDWYMVSGNDLFNNKSDSKPAAGLGIIIEGCYWSANGCCQIAQDGSTQSQPCWNSCWDCGYNTPQDFKKGWSVYCVTNF